MQGNIGEGVAFEALSHPTRRAILQYLQAHPHASVNAIAGQFGVSRPAVSKHIKVLEAGGFISVSEAGRERLCAISGEGFRKITDWVNLYEQFWSTKLNRLIQLLDENEPQKQG